MVDLGLGLVAHWRGVGRGGLERGLDVAQEDGRGVFFLAEGAEEEGEFEGGCRGEENGGDFAGRLEVVVSIPCL